MSDDEARAFVSARGSQPMLGSGDWRQLATASREGDELLGDLGLCGRQNGDAELGITLRHEAQGGGLATEALRGLARALVQRPQVERLVGITDERNLAPMRLLERLGMTWASRYPAVYQQAPCVELRYELSRETAQRINAP